MTAAVPSHPSGPRRTARLGLLAVAAAVLAAPAVLATPPAGAAVGWDVRWSAPVTAAGPNAFRGAPEVQGTALPPLGIGNPSSVAFTMATPGGFPAACVVPGGNAALTGRTFTIQPTMACNGTYVLSVVATQQANLLNPNSPALRAPIALADPGPAPATPSGGIAGRRVTLSWVADPDPDVVGYRIRRNGQTVAEPARGTGAFTDEVPAAGAYTYDLQVLRWGAGGPGSPAIASPPSAPATATIVDGAPPTGVGGGGGGSGTGGGSGGTGTGGGTGGGGTGGTGGSDGGSTGTGSLPPAGTASPRVPAAGKSSGPIGSRSTYRSGGTISPRSSSSGSGSGSGSSGSSATTATTEPDTFAERLPYQAKDTGRTVELADPDTTRTVARTTTIPGTAKPGLLVPMAVVLVLVAASLQIRAFLRRTPPAGIELEPGLDET